MLTYEETKEVNTKPSKVWSAALYVRLSREDLRKTGEKSGSITIQEEILKEFVRQNPDIKIYDIYEDDGWSGTNFTRPGFQRMLNDIDNGLVDCVIVKDLSRFARNAGQSLLFTDEYFVRRKIRFIAINDILDSKNKDPNDSSGTLTVGVKNLVNEHYAAATSVSTRGSLNCQKKMGNFIGSFAPYGYEKDPENKHHLVIDEDAAQVVRQIFDSFIKGTSVTGIVKELNDIGIPNPTAYKKLKCPTYNHTSGINNSNLWTYKTVRRILEDEKYIGNMVQGKSRIISYKINQIESVPEEEWIRVENTHEPIIDKKTFDEVQAFLKKNVRTAPKKANVDLFAGFIKCADCHRAMTKKTNNHSYGHYEYYRCTTNIKIKTDACKNHSIRVDKLYNTVKESIQFLIDTAINWSEVIKEVNKSPKRVKESIDLNNLLKMHEDKRKELVNLKLGLYPDYKSGRIDEDEYFYFKNDYKSQIEKIDKDIAKVKEKIEHISNGITEQNKFLSTFKKYGKIDTLTRAMLIELVDTIEVEQNGNITINFKFKDAFNEAQEYINLNKDLVSKPA